MIQEIGSENNNANDMEKLEELDESVDKMMKEMSIYQQAQKGSSTYLQKTNNFLIKNSLE